MRIRWDMRNCGPVVPNRERSKAKVLFCNWDKRQNLFEALDNGTLKVFVAFCFEGRKSGCMCVSVHAQNCTHMLAVIYITCLHLLVCILLQSLTFLSLPSGPLLALSCSPKYHTADPTITKMIMLHSKHVDVFLWNKFFFFFLFKCSLLLFLSPNPLFLFFLSPSKVHFLWKTNNATYCTQ